VSDNRTEEPTQHRISEARKKGQIAKSNDLALSFVFVASLIFLSSMGKNIFQTLTSATRYTSVSFTNTEISILTINRLIMWSFQVFASAVAPFMAVLVISGILGHVIQGGLVASGEHLKPKLDKMDPISGAKKLFSSKAMIEALKNIIRFLIIITVFWGFLTEQMPVILSSSRMSIQNVFMLYGKVSIGLFNRMTILLVVLGVLDYVLQRYLFMQEMRMTKQEVKEEYKTLEGDPFLKQRMRSRQRELIKKLMLEGVKDAKVVITNPTHIACALRFDEEKDDAPVLIAKGKGFLAEQIKELARKYKVEIVENKPLARAMYKDLEVGDVIPPEMYQAVAEIIAFIERLNAGLERRL